MSLSRRQFIQASGIALCAGAVPLRAMLPGSNSHYLCLRCWNPPWTATFLDSTTHALVLYARNSRGRLGD